LEVAHHNEQDFVVEAINGHRGDRHKRSSMKFRVSWAGFGETCDSWEPYKAILHVDKLHNYLRATAMKSLISSEHKWQVRRIFFKIFLRIFPDGF
jgi:hypothetical protein